MLRRALTYWLVLAVAVGPLLCCCTAGPASARTSPAAPAPARAAATSCCGHKRDTQKPERPAPAKPQPPGGKCPCKDGSGQLETVRTDASAADLSALLRMLTLDAVPAFDAAPAARAPRAGPSDRPAQRERAGETTARLLDAHHNLRC